MLPVRECAFSSQSVTCTMLSTEPSLNSQENKSISKQSSFFSSLQRRCDPDALLDFNQVSWLAFNMTISGMTPAVSGPVPCHFLPNTPNSVSFPCHQMTGQLLWRANERKRGQTKRNCRKTGSSFPPRNTIHRINPPSALVPDKAVATLAAGRNQEQQLLVLEKISFEMKR